MFNIKDYLEKFQRLGQNDKESKVIIAEIISSVLNIKIEIKNIELKDGVVFVKENSIIKNSIFIKKNALIDKFKSKGLNIFDLR